MGDDFLNSNSSEDELPKQPFRRLELAITQVTRIAIPIHVKLLKQQSENIENYKTLDRMLQLHAEQIKASNTVRLLKADLYELERINAQVRDEDSELFHERIQSPTRDVIEVLSCFMELHSDILQPFPEVENTVENSNDIPALVCNLEQEFEIGSNDISPVGETYGLECQYKSTTVSSGIQKHWSNLKKELLEVNELIKKFASLVFVQQKQVDNIENNILEARENVVIGTKHLKKAAILRTASIPFAGAVIGGLLLGPVGALAGFKILGSAVCAAGGGFLGYGAGCKLKQKQQASCDFELKALTYPSKSLSVSAPDLPLILDNSTANDMRREEQSS